MLCDVFMCVKGQVSGGWTDRGELGWGSVGWESSQGEGGGGGVVLGYMSRLLMKRTA